MQAVEIAEANTGTAFTIPANLSPTGKAETVLYTLVAKPFSAPTPTLNTAVSTAGISTQINTTFNTFVSAENSANAAVGLYDSGADDMNGAGVNAAYKYSTTSADILLTSAEAAFEAAGLGTAAFWSTVYFNDPQYAAPGNCGQACNQGSYVWFTSAIDNTSLAFAIDTAFHELGHVLTPELGQAMDDAIKDYGPNSAQAIAATLADENAANVIGAGVYAQTISGGQVGSATFNNALNDFVQGYIGNEDSSDDGIHGTPAYQMAVISAAYPTATLQVPDNILAEDGITSGAPVYIKGLAAVNADGSPAVPDTEQKEVTATIDTDETTDVKDDGGLDTEGSVSEGNDPTEPPPSSGDGDGGGDGDCEDGYC